MKARPLLSSSRDLAPGLANVASLAVPAVGLPRSGYAGDVTADDFAPRRSRPVSVWRIARRYPVGVASGLVLLAIVLAAALAPLIVQHSPTQLLSASLQGPSSEAWLGTDQAGRDLLSRLLYGTRTSLLIAGVATAIGVSIGAAFGLVSGYLGGVVDLVLQRALDTFDAFPTLVLLILFVSLMGASTLNVLIAIAVVLVPGVNRVARSVTLGIRSLDYIEASISLGASPLHVMWRHIAPGLLVPLTLIASGALGGSIIAEASLSFLGLGSPPPTPTLGSMLSNDVRQYFITEPWLAIAPGVFIATILLATSLLADTLRDVLDPRIRSR